jgi:nucleoid-associated protein YgaU
VSRDPSSRHQDLERYEVSLAPGAEPVELYVPRVIPVTPASQLHSVKQSDRLDLLGHKFYGDPFQYWRIADANPSLTPDDALDPGALISIPAKPRGE